MRKLFSIALALVFTATLAAKDLSGVRIYINPGHGGWNEINDRHMPTIPYPQYTKSGMVDTLGFWESSSNLKVALDLDTLLKAAHATVLLSRYDNRSGYSDNGEMDWDKQKKHYTDDLTIGDRPFNSIKDECNAFNADILLSIHSNGANRGNCNYLVAFVAGNVGNSCYRYGATFPETGIYADSILHYVFDNPLDCWAEGDDKNWQSFTSSWGMVSQNHASTMPAILVEAAFHSYPAQLHRFLNRDCQRLEAHRFYRGLCACFGADFLPTGIIAGDVRSANIKETRAQLLPYISNPLNLPKAKDKWMAMDGSKVELMKDGQVIKTYITDNCCNGMYAFYGLQPGDYQVRINAHHAAELIEDVHVRAGLTTTINSYVTDSAYLRPLTPDYPNQAIGATFPEKFNMIEHPVVATPFLDGLNIRRMLTRGEKTYVLDDQSHIYIVNTYTGAQIGQLSTQGATEGLRAISDIAFTSDTVLLACNMQKIAKTDTKAHINIYKWADDQANPEILYTINHAGGYTEAELGGTMTVCGNIWWHKLMVSAVSADTKRQISIVGVEYRDNEIETGIVQTRFFMNTKSYTEAKWGSDFYLTNAANDDFAPYILVDGKQFEVTEFNFNFDMADKSQLVKLNSIADNKLAKESYGISFLQYAEHYLMLVPVCDAGGVNYGLQLFEMPLNSDNTNIISVSNAVTDKLPQAGLNAASVDYVYSASVVDGEDLNLVLYLKGIGIARYATRLYSGIEEVMASELDMNTPAYDVMGREIDIHTFRGVMIQNGKKYLLK